MGNQYRGIHEKIALKARDYFGITALIETGTYNGATALWASDKFERVATIELSPLYYRVAENTCANAHNVLMIQGDSREWLAPICRGRYNRPTMFWLDAHDSGERDTVDPNGPSLLEEIKIINDNFFGTDVVMVDDVHLELFNQDDVVRLLKDKYRREVLTVDDIYFACNKIPDEFETWCENAESIRYY